MALVYEDFTLHLLNKGIFYWEQRLCLLNISIYFYFNQIYICKVHFRLRYIFKIVFCTKHTFLNISNIKVKNVQYIISYHSAIQLLNRIRCITLASTLFKKFFIIWNSNKDYFIKNVKIFIFFIRIHGHISDILTIIPHGLKVDYFC